MNCSYTGRVFIKVICWVGGDIEYGIAAIKALTECEITIAAIVGRTAPDVSRAFCTFDKLPPGVVVIEKKRPWEDTSFAMMYSECPRLLGINCGFDYLIPKGVLELIPTVNLHPSLLPHNRGCHHSFYGIMEETPLGATLHWMTVELDAGPIIDSRTFHDDGVMSAGTIQKKSNDLCIELLKENIQQVMTGVSKSEPQKGGSYHSKAEIISRSTLDISDVISVKEVLKLCRATNAKGNGFFIRNNRGKYKIVVDRIEFIETKMD